LAALGLLTDESIVKLVVLTRDLLRIEGKKSNH